MKKFVSVLLTVLVILSSVTVMAAENVYGDNLLENPGFEEAFDVKYWVNEGCGIKLMTTNETEPHSGVWSMRVSGRTTANSTLRHPVTVSYNTPYYVSLWMKLPAGEAPADFMIGFDGAWVWLNQSTATVTDQWTKLEGIVKWSGTTGETTSVAMRINGGAAVKEYYTDDWYMAKLTEQQMADYVTSGLSAKSIGAESIHYITTNLTLPTTNTETGATLSWESDTKNVISNTGVVTRDGEDHTVTLTVTATVGATSSTKSFQVFVPAVSNLIGNGNFENGYDNFSKGLNLHGLGSWGLKQNDSAGAHGGSAYLELNRITAGTDGLRCPLVLENNVPYYFSIWLKVPEGNTASFNMYLVDSSNTWIPVGSPVTVSGEWTNLKAIYTHKGTSGDSTKVNFWANQTAPVSSIYYVDDIYVAKGGASIGSIEFYSAGNSPSYQNDDGVTALSAPEEGVLAASVLVRNGGDTEQTMTLILAVYDAENRLVKTVLRPQTVGAYEDAVIYGTINCGNAAYTVKGFLWDGTDTCSPLIPGKTIPAQ